MSSQLQVTGEAKIRDIQGPVVANSGVITALNGAANQYVRGDGTLASFPTSGGGGSSVSYYLNGSVNQGTFGGSTYYQMSKNAIVGTGTNFSTSANGLIAQFITDANDPDVVSIPSGNWNVEFFMNVSASSGALASFYVEFYKYNGTTFTLLATNVATPEQLTNTTTVDAYYTSVAMPLSTMAVTDRLAIRIFVNVAGKTVTLYTEDNRLCQVVTTFSKGLASLNNLTDQSQYLTTGTSGTNFAIVSSGDTHTFNLPTASATNTGKLSSTDWSTFNNKLSTATAAATYVPYTGATTNVDLGFFNFDANQINGFKIIAKLDGTNSGSLILRTGTSGYSYGNDSISLISSPTSANTLTIISDVSLVTKIAQIGLGSLTATRTFTLPDSSGTLALTSNLSSYVPYTGATANVNLGVYDISVSGIKVESNVSGGTAVNIKQNSTTLIAGAGYISIGAKDLDTLLFQYGGATNSDYKVIRLKTTNIPNTTSRAYEFPNADGTIALTSNLSSYVPYNGATQELNLGLQQILAGQLRSGYDSGTPGQINPGSVLMYHPGTSWGVGIRENSTLIHPGSATTLRFRFFQSTTTNEYQFILNAASLTLNTPRTYTLPDASGTLALTSNLSAYLPLTGGTLTGALSGTSATFSSTTTATAFIPSGSTIPTNGMYLSAANTLNFATNSANRFTIASDGIATFGTDLYVNRNIYVNNIEAGVYADFHGRNSTGTSVPLTFLYGSAGDVVWNNGGTKMTLTSAGALQLVSSISATSATFSGALTVTNNVTIRPTSGYNAYFQTSGTALRINYLNDALSANISASYRATDYSFQNGSGSSVLTIASTGAATFSSTVRVEGSYLQIANATNPSLYINNTSVQWQTYVKSNNNYAISDAVRDVLTLGYNGSASFFQGCNVGIGTSSPAVLLHSSPAATADLVTALFTAGNSDGNFKAGFANGSGTGVASEQAKIGMWYGTSGNPLVHFGLLRGNSADGLGITFNVNNTERMRITSSGALLVGTTSNDFGSRQVNYSATSYTYHSVRTGTGSEGHLVFSNANGAVGSIFTNGSSTSYNTSSDYRLKQDLKDFNGLSLISSIKTYDYEWKADNTRAFGVIAHELAEVLPYAVSGEKDGEMMQGVDYSKIVPILIKSIQELEARIKQLENK